MHWGVYIYISIHIDIGVHVELCKTFWLMLACVLLDFWAMFDQFLLDTGQFGIHFDRIFHLFNTWLSFAWFRLMLIRCLLDKRQAGDLLQPSSVFC